MSILLGFNMTSMSEDACDDLEGLDASATHVANLLASEPDDGMFSICIRLTNHEDWYTHSTSLSDHHES